MEDTNSTLRDILVFIDVMLVVATVGYAVSLLKDAKNGRFDGWR